MHRATPVALEEKKDETAMKILEASISDENISLFYKKEDLKNKDNWFLKTLEQDGLGLEDKKIDEIFSLETASIIEVPISKTELGIELFETFSAIHKLIKTNNFKAIEEYLSVIPSHLMGVLLALSKEENGHVFFTELVFQLNEEEGLESLFIKIIDKTPTEDLVFRFTSFTEVIKGTELLSCLLLAAQTKKFSPMLMDGITRIIDILPQNLMDYLVSGKSEEGKSPLITVADITKPDHRHFFQILDRVSPHILKKGLFEISEDINNFQGCCIELSDEGFIKFLNKIDSSNINEILIDKRKISSFENINSFQFFITYLKPVAFNYLIERASIDAIDISLVLPGFKGYSGFIYALLNLKKDSLACIAKKTPHRIEKLIKELDLSVLTRTGESNLAFLKNNLSMEDSHESKEMKEPSSRDPIEIPKNRVEFKIEEGKVKSAPELLTEIKHHNPNLDITEFKTALDAIHSTYEKKSAAMEGLLDKEIKYWEKKDCQLWAKTIRNKKLNIRTEFILEMIAVVLRATEIDTGYKPRETQLISTLMFLNASDKGRLAQISTGEGKSLIVAMLAVLKALTGKKVDIITSSPILAMREAKEKENFYSLFNLTVDCNWDKKNGESYGKGFKTCYNADIVYGDGASFQWDLLRHEYNLLNTRGDRGFDTVIADEVDSMFLDELSNISIIGSIIPAMEYLEALLSAVWAVIPRIERELLDSKLDLEDKIIIIKKILTKYITDLVTKESSQIYIPKHLREFAIAHIETWVESAITARYRYQEGKDYIVVKEKGEDVIAPIDYLNTGVISSNVIWENGLHQFLQLKHNVPLHSEPLLSCYISNLSFFKRYGQNVFGMTGTLGGEADQSLLKFLYPVDLVFIPTFKVKQFKELPGILSPSKQDWLESIIHSVIEETAKNRAALILCESINVVDEIQAELIKKYHCDPARIKRYARNDTLEHEVVAQKLEAGQILIATNLAGRGTDIKISKLVEASGGLHVCLTFLPRNKRVEDQAFGRAARQGKLGDARKVINKKDLENIYRLSETTTLEDINHLRDLQELADFSEIKRFKEKKMRLKDELFSQMCSLRSSLRTIEDNEYKLSEIADKFGKWIGDLEKKLNHTPVLETKNISEILAAFEIFKQKCADDYKNELLDPCQLILSSKITEEPKKAIASLTKAIDFDPIVSVQAYFNRAFARLNAKLGNYRQDAVNDLNIAKSILEEHLIPQLQAMQVIKNLSDDQSGSDTPLIKQIQRKIDFYQLEINHIQDAISKIVNASSDSELEVHPTNALMESCSSLQLSDKEIVELYHSGLQNFFQIEEIELEDDDGIFGILGVAFLGVLQIVVGVAVTFVGLGNVGAILVSEGISDILFAARSAIDGRFSWKDYQASKTTSIAINIITMGISAIRGGITAPGLTSAKAVSKDQFVLMAKEKITNALVVSGIKQTVSFGLDHLTKTTLKTFESDIRREVENTIRDAFNNIDLKIGLNKLFAEDIHNRNFIWANKLKQLSFEIIRSKHETNDITMNILKGVLSRQFDGLEKLSKTFDIGRALSKIIYLTQDFCEDFTKAVKIYSASFPTPTKDLIELRSDYCKQITALITKSIMTRLHHGVIRPLSHSVMSDSMDKLSRQIHKTCFSPAVLFEEKESKFLNLKTHPLDKTKSTPDIKQADIEDALSKSQRRPFKQSSLSVPTYTNRGHSYNAKKFNRDCSTPPHKVKSPYSISENIDLNFLLKMDANYHSRFSFPLRHSEASLAHNSLYPFIPPVTAYDWHKITAENPIYTFTPSKQSKHEASPHYFITRNVDINFLRNIKANSLGLLFFDKKLNARLYPGEKTLLQYSNYIKFHRNELPISEINTLNGFRFDKEKFKQLLDEYKELRNIFYNRDITINFHTDGPVGHVSGDLPIVAKDGKIIIVKDIGLFSKENEPIVKLFSGAKGEIVSKTRSSNKSNLLKASISITDEQYIQLAKQLRKAVDNPPMYNVLGANDKNCIKWMNRLLVEAGIHDGIKNKFSYDDFHKLDWRAIKMQAAFFFDEYELDHYKAKTGSLYDIDEFAIEQMLIKNKIDMLEQQKFDAKIKQIDSDIATFIERTTNKKSPEIMHSHFSPSLTSPAPENIVRLFDVRRR